MMVKPWAKAIAAIPGRPTPSPTTAAAPAPMNTNAKVPMNSARSLGAREFDIIGLQKCLRRSARPASRQEHASVCVSPTSRSRPTKRALLRGDHLRREIDAKRLLDAGAICGIGFGAVGDMALLDFDARVTHGAGSVLEQKPPLFRTHLPEQDAGLLVVIIIDTMVPIGRITLDRQRRFDQRFVPVHPRTFAVGPIGRCGAEIAIGPHLAIAVITEKRAFRRVHRDMVEIDAQPISLGVPIREEPAL